MVWFRLTLVIIGLAALNGGCAPYKSTYQKSSVSSGYGNSGNALAKGGSLTEIILSTKQMAGQETSYTALARLGGLTSARVQLVATTSGAKFQITGLPINKPDVLTVEIYQGDQIKFVAKKAATQLTADNSTPVQIQECQMLAAPWNGKTSDGGCNWEIEEVK